MGVWGTRTYKMTMLLDRASYLLLKEQKNASEYIRELILGQSKQIKIGRPAKKPYEQFILETPNNIALLPDTPKLDLSPEKTQVGKNYNLFETITGKPANT